jgi:hypothetical protein
LPVGKPSLRLLADETAKVLAGMVWVLDALALLVNASRSPAWNNTLLAPSFTGLVLAKRSAKTRPGNPDSR